MFRSPLLALLSLVIALNSFSQSINTSAISGSPFCAGATVNVPYTISGSFTSGNVFTAELSDPTGSFTTRTTIGTLTSTSAGTITAIIPATQAGGTQYRIRVVSSTPAVTGINNGTNLTINALGLNAPTFTGTTFCAGASFTVNYTLTNSCVFLSGNTFTALLSNSAGSFASPVTIGSVSSTTSGSISVTLPTSTVTGSGYRIRIAASNPAINSPTNASALTINALGINTPTITGGATSFCQGQAFTVNYTVQNSCGFPNTPASNIFTAQLSDASGSFAAPTDLGTVTASNSGSISANIGNAPAGTGYRIRVVSSNGSIVSANNGSNLTINASSGNPSVFGTTEWNNYIYSGTAFPISSNTYLGTYTETNLSFNTANRWASGTAPSTANTSSGTAYSGCPVGASNISISFKRTNFTCGYYQIDVPTHDDYLRLFIDGTLVFGHTNGCCDAHTNVWTGFLGPASTVEFQLIQFAGGSGLNATFSAATNPLVVSNPATICSTSNITLNVSAPISLNYSWTPTTGLTPSDGLGASVVAAPTVTTTYTATGTDATTGCTLTKTVPVTVVSPATIPTLSLTNVSSPICSGITTSTISVTGAATYTWSPTTGLTFQNPEKSVAIANPSSTTSYTVTGSTGCQTANINTTVTVQNVPVTPVPATDFGNGVWNAYCHNNTTLSNYYGYYTESGVSFNTTTKWGSSNGPTTTTGYVGCSFGSTNYSISFKRTNFTCGYYQIDIPFQDDFLTLLIDGVQVFQNNAYTPTLQSNIWTGFLGPTSTVEFRLVNNNGPGNLQVSITPSSNRPQTINSNITVCAGTNAALSATSAITGATYSWSVSPSDPTVTFAPSSTISNPFIQTTGATVGPTYTVTNTLTDAALTGCSVTKSLTLTVDPLPSTSVTPAAVTTSCPSAGITLTASGAANYTWSPSTGLSATSGFSVVATPTVTTTYTVVGSNNCSIGSATSTITVIPIPAYTTFPTGTWNVYGFNSQTLGTNYQGYYTENGSGPTGYSFNSTTRWTSGTAPSTANATNGNAWLGCTMSATNISMSAKRTGFACGMYQIDIPAHDDSFYLLINGVEVARHVGCCDAHTAVWTGVLNSNSTVELQMQQGAGGSYLAIGFTLIAQPAGTTLWLGGTSNDWFTASNWCNGIPTSTTDALIPVAGPQNMPVINNTAAVTRSLTINPAIPAVTGTITSPAIAAASLTSNSFNLDVNGNWTNNGTFTANAGSVSFVGSGSNSTISTNGTQSFNNLIINKTNGVTFSSGINQISGTMTFTNGVVTQNATLRILNGASVASVSNTSYVDGPVTKVGNSAFTFPLGRANLYRPISISAPAVATDSYTAQYFNVNPNGTYPNASRASTIDHVSGAEYWMLNQTSGTSSVNVTLSWGSNSGVVDNLSRLRVAAWNGSQWTDQGNGGTTGSFASGTIINSAPTSIFGPFTLSSTSPFSNALPVELTSFNCALTSSGFVSLTWTTASEKNSDYFELQRSDDSQTFKTIGRVKSAGTTILETNYSFEDKFSPIGYAYYRLKQVDFDGTATYSKPCSVEGASENNAIKIFPNPNTNGSAYINLNGSQCNGLSIINSVGQEVNCNYTIEPSRVVINTQWLAGGVYIVKIVINQKLTTLKLIVQK
ncbi:MAG: T9SS type A sorting domain-containing protein [Bacteroidetes bacterium]|nr:T9SS type A sorting domain-containing protein [Bacteroidota bacterium]